MALMGLGGSGCAEGSGVKESPGVSFSKCRGDDGTERHVLFWNFCFSGMRKLRTRATLTSVRTSVTGENKAENRGYGRGGGGGRAVGVGIALFTGCLGKAALIR